MKTILTIILVLFVSWIFAQSNGNLQIDTSVYSNPYLSKAIDLIGKDGEIKQISGLLEKACPEKHHEDYFNFAEYAIIQAIYSERINLVDEILIDLEAALDNQKNPNSSRMVIYRGRMLKAYLLKNYEKSLLYAQKILELNETHQRYAPNQLAPLYVDIGKNHVGLQQYDIALRWMYRGLETTTARDGTPERGTFYFNLAHVYEEKGGYQFAIELYKQVIAAFLKDKEHNKENLAIAYGNLSSIYVATKEYSKAITTLEQIDAVTPLVYEHLLTLANIYGLQYEYAQALEVIQQALIEVSLSFNENDILHNPSDDEVYKSDVFAAAILSTKGYLLYELGKESNDITKMKIGLATVNQSIQIEEAQKASIKGFEKSKFTINRSILSRLNYMLDGQYELYQLDRSDDGFNAFITLSERRKAMQLLETLSPSNLPKNLREEEKILTKNIQLIQQQLDVANFHQQKDSIPYYQNALFVANLAMEEFLEKTRQQYDEQKTIDTEVKYANATAIKAALESDAAVISYSYHERKGYITVITSTAQEILELDISELERRIHSFNEYIQDRFAFQRTIRNDFIETSHQLYETLLTPIENYIKDKKRLMFIVEGRLFELPLELLLQTNEQKNYHELDYLIKRFEVNYHYSATTFLQLQERTLPQNHSLLAFAPVFEKGNKIIPQARTRSLDVFEDSLYISIEDDKFTPLPNTLKEVQAIQELLPNNIQNKVLLKEEASKTNFLNASENQSYQFVHIATHGLANFENYTLSAFACYSEDGEIDNLLYAKEIQFHNIQADLVVLSSCESGIGRLVQGDGLIALNRSFIASGAKNVLFSLWKISDKYSSDLMIDFYKSYLDNGSSSYTSALRNAKLKMLKNSESAEPKYWAAFVLIGE